MIGTAALLAALQLRWTAEDEVTIGVPLPVPDDGSTLPVTVSLPPGGGFGDLVNALAAAWAEAAEHATGDVAQSIAESLAGRDLATDPLFTCAVAALSGHNEGLPGVQLLAVAESDQVILQLSDVEPATADCLHRQLQALAAQVRLAPDRPLATIDLTDGASLEQVHGWGTGPVAADATWTIPEKVSRQATTSPDATAVRCGGYKLTYSELDRASTGLAVTLQANGIAPGDRVAVCVERSADLVCALLAVLKTGAAYVPLDPDYPRDRLDYMIEDSGAAAVIVGRGGGFASSGGPVVRVDDVGETTRFVPPSPSAGDVAYVIYTSGSTGRPKGVVVPTTALRNFLTSVAAVPGFSAGERLLAVTTISFDIAGLEVWLPLTHGGAVVIADSRESRDPNALSGLIEAEHIDVMQATPTTWRMLLEGGWGGSAQLRALCGGEALPPELATELVSSVGELWNMYGPTETTIWSTLARIERHSSVTLGRPFLNTTLHVVDEAFRTVPPGVPGELLIGGTGLAVGYHRRPELTAEKFLVSPPCAPGRRVYRTGDLVKWSPSGDLQFLGRLDHQVKVNGHRIELGEIEAVLGNRPDIRETVAVARETGTGAKQLVAYVVGDADPQQVRKELQDVLPRYMIPNVVVVLDALPRTLNGKVDRKALPSPEEHRGSVTSIARPTSALQERLVAIWREVLGLPDVGIHDDFFTLGADSLTAARLFARIQRELDCELPLAPVLAAPTVAELAALIESTQTSRGPERFRSLVRIQPNGIRPPFFAVHGGAGTVLLYAELARRLGNDQPFYGLQAIGLYGKDAPQQSVPQMAASYIQEIRRVQPAGPYRVGGYCYGALVAFEIARQLRSAGDQVELVVTFNGPAPGYLRRYRAVFDEEGPIFDEQGQHVQRVKPREPGLRASLRRNAAGRRPREAVVAVSRAARRRLARRASRRRQQWRLGLSLRLQRPLPDSMREASWFQLLAGRAQDAYDPPTIDVPILVFRATGLYHTDDLGWRDYTTQPVHCVEVLGAGQHIPRMSMREPWVEQVADALSAALAGQALAATDRKS